MREPPYESLAARLPLRTGDVVFIPPVPEEYAHLNINASDKYLAMASSDGVRSFSAIQRPGMSLDYWDGEA